MGIFGRIFRSRSQQQERSDTRTAIVEALTRAIAERGYATHQDCADLGLPRSTVFYHLNSLVKQGKFRRGGHGRYYANPPATITTTNADNDSDAPPAPIIRKSTAELLAEIEASRPPPPDPPDPRLLPVPPEHRRICPMPSSEPTPEHLHDETLAWHDLQQHIPDAAMDWARREWGLSLKHGIPPAYAHANILKQLPDYVFREVQQYYPRFPREAFDAYVTAGVPLEQILQDVKRAFADSKSHKKASSPAPVNVAPLRDDEYGKQIAGRPREVADPSGFSRNQEVDLHLLQAGKNRTRSFISMDQQSPSNFERALVDTCRAQYGAHAQKVNGGANSSAPSLAMRIRSWFN